MAEIAFVPIMDKITDSSYLIYDGACGTGGILSVSCRSSRQTHQYAYFWSRITAGDICDMQIRPPYKRGRRRSGVKLKSDFQIHLNLHHE